MGGGGGGGGLFDVVLNSSVSVMLSVCCGSQFFQIPVSVMLFAVSLCSSMGVVLCICCGD